MLLGVEYYNNFAIAVHMLPFLVVILRDLHSFNQWPDESLSRIIWRVQWQNFLYVDIRFFTKYIPFVWNWMAKHCLITNLLDYHSCCIFQLKFGWLYLHRLNLPALVLGIWKINLAHNYDLIWCWNRSKKINCHCFPIFCQTVCDCNGSILCS